MKKIIINTKYLSPDYRATLDHDRIGFRGNSYDYVLVTLAVLYVLGFLIIMSS